MKLPTQTPLEPVARVESCDPREQELQSRDLPDDVKVLVRERWRADSEQLSAIHEAEGRHRVRSIAQGCALFAGVELSLTTPDLARLFVATLVGAAVGWLWHRVQAGQVSAPGIAMAASILHQLTWLGVAAGSPVPFLFSPFILGSASVWLGMRRDMRHYG